MWNPNFISKTPSAPRSSLSLWVFCVLLMSSSGALAQASVAERGPALTERDVIRIASELSPRAAVASASEKAAESLVRSSGLLENPSLIWARESVDTGPRAARGSQDLFGMNIPIDPARARAERALKAAQGSWLRTDASLERLDVIRTAVLAYYDVALATERVHVLTQALSNLDEAARVLEVRKAAGSVSGYDRARLSIERELSQSHLVEARAEVEGERLRLAAILGRPAEGLSILAELTLLAPERERALEEGGGLGSVSFERAQESERLANEASERADLTWLPSIELGAGLKRANNFGSESGLGYFVGASVSLPIFDRGQAYRLQAAAEKNLVAARTDALEKTVSAEVTAALAALRMARAELERFEQATSAPVAELLKAARSGYREGERSIVELLDAQRAQTEVLLRRLSLLGIAKKAEVHLRASAGGLK